MQKNIYHLHDVCCNHATLTLEDAVKYAIEHKYKALYGTEHCPVSIKCGYQSRRTPYNKMLDLKSRVDKFNEQYKSKLHIYFGYECEFNKNNRWYFEKLARDSICEFMIMGLHFYGDIFKDPWPYDYTINDTNNSKQLKEYEEMAKAGMESGLFSGFPHPEIWLNSYAKWDKYALSLSKKLIQLAIKTKTPLGFNINCNPFEEKDEWHYPSPHFGKLVAKTDAIVIVESDAHSLDKLTVEGVNKGRKVAQSFGLAKNISNTIAIKGLPKRPLLVLYEQELKQYINKDLLESFKAKKVIVKKIDSKTDIVKICKKLNIHPVWTIGLINDKSILAKVKKTSIYVISNQSKYDLNLNDFAHMTYKQFLKEFIKEAK